MIETASLTRQFGNRKRRARLPRLLPGARGRQSEGVVAVDALTLIVGQGEIFGLVGPDGAGKTTTIRMLAAILDPSAGHATVAGFDTMRQSEAVKRRIGYMAQEFNLYGDLSVQENLDFYADIFGVRGRERRQRRQQLLDFARLAEFRQRRAAQLSGGMKKKLALACALIHQPQVLFLDEPTTGVDPVSRREFWDILSDLHVQGVTILVSTPYMDEAERCSRVGLMYQGRLIVHGSPPQIKDLVRGELVELRPYAHAGPQIQVRSSSPGPGIGLMLGTEALITQLPGVLEVQTYGDVLQVFVDDAGKRMPQLEAALAAQGIQTPGLRRAPVRMEQAFISLIRQQDPSSNG